MSCPLRGTSAPTESSETPGPPEPAARGAGSVPGSTTPTRAASAPNSSTSRRAVSGEVATIRATRPNSVALRRPQRVAIGLGEAGFQRRRVVDQRHRAALRQRIGQRRKGRQAEAVHHRHRVRRQRIEGAASAGERRVVRQRMPARELHHLRIVAERAQPRDQPPVVTVAPRDRVERARNEERDPHPPISPKDGWCGSSTDAS